MKRFNVQDRVVDVCITTILVIIGLICIYPIWFVVIASFSDPTQISAGNVLLLPKGFNLNGYIKLLEYPDIWIGYRNSILYLFGGTFISLLVTLTSGFALSHKDLVGRKFLNILFVISMYFSGGLIPTYLLHVGLGWVGTIWVILIPSALNVYYMILARSAFESIPTAIRESAKMDGCSDFRYFIQFALPLCKATIAVLFLFMALGWWNEYMRFVIYIDEPNLQSLQVIVRQIVNSITSTLSDTASAEELAIARQQSELLRYSIVVVVALPFVILYPFVQKFFNKGVMIGAVKG